MSKSNPNLVQHRKDLGFTLIELIVTVLILGILTAAALPSFREFISNQRIKNAAFDIMSMVTLARSEAIKRNANVTVSFDPATNFFTVTAAGVTPALLLQEMFSDFSLKCVNVATHTAMTCPAGWIVYDNSGHLVSAFGPMEISSTATAGTNVTCISLDLGGRPNSKKGNC